MKTEDKLVGWSTGTVEQLLSGNIIEVLFDGTDNIKAKVISKDTAPYGLHSGERNWRKELKEGSEIDYLDKWGIWYQCIVKSKLENNDLILKANNENVEFVDFKEENAKGISCFSLRIQKPGTIAKFGEYDHKEIEDKELNNNESIWSSGEPAENKSVEGDNEVGEYEKSEDDEESKYNSMINDDASDVLVNSLDNKISYGVFRPSKMPSPTFIEIVDTFGQEGGFDNIIKRISDTTKCISYSIFYLYYRSTMQLYIHIS